MAESFDGPHLPHDVLTDVRFWMQAIRDSKRTIFCPPEILETVEDAVAENGMQAYFDVVASAACPPNRILIVDTQAIQAGADEAIQLGFNRKRT